MYSIIKQNDHMSAYVTEFVVDTDGDIAELPINVYPGSTALVAGSSEVYILNNNKEWVKL